LKNKPQFDGKRNTDLWLGFCSIIHGKWLQTTKLVALT